MMGLVPLQEEHAQRKGHVRTQAEGNCLQARKRVLTKNQICQHLDLELLSPQNYEK